VTAAELIADKLHAHGCRLIFAISGAGNVFLFDAIANHSELDYACPHHEQAGVMAAIAYTRILKQDRLGVMMTTGGPGAVNAFTGALNAWADSVPVVIISGQEKTPFIEAGRKLRMWGVQGFDVIRAVSGFCKYAVMVTDADSVGYHIDRAFHEATTGRPGPVWIDVPMDIQSAVVDPACQQVFTAPERLPRDLRVVSMEIAELIRRSRRPVFLLGNGIRLSGAEPLLPELIDKFPIPIITAWSGMDMIPSDHPLCFGHAGVYGQRCGNFVVQNSDLLVCIGTRLAIPQVGYELAEYARAAKKVVVDIDAAELAKFDPPVDFPVHADAMDFILGLLDTSVGAADLQTGAWVAQCRDWQARYPIIEPEHHISRPGRLNAYRFIAELNHHLGPDDIVVADAGAAHTCTQQTVSLRSGQRILATTGLGEMGYGLPAAIGAAFARPASNVILITGDGSMMMNLQELQTVVHHLLPVKIFLYENDGYLTIRTTQNSLFQGRQAGSGRKTGVSCPDFLRVAAAFGIPVFSLSQPADAAHRIHEVLAEDGPALCVVYMDPEQAFVPKLSLSTAANGALVSPPLEDLSPLLPRDQLAAEMIVGLHPKSKDLEVPLPQEVTA
jgi:acetolactate synthase-1/2/3 large subunit